MTDKKKADQQASPKDMRVNDTNGNSHRACLVSHLRQQGSINMFEAIRPLNILRPSACIADSSTITGATPMQQLRNLRAAAHRHMAISALRADSSLSTRLARYQHHITKARALEALGGAQ